MHLAVQIQFTHYQVTKSPDYTEKQVLTSV